MLTRSVGATRRAVIRTLIAALAVAANLLTPLPATAEPRTGPSAAHPEYTPSTRAFFNRVSGNSNDALTDEFVKLIDSAHGSITVAAFRFDEPRITEALIRAARRGLALTVIVNAEAGEQSQFKYLQGVVASTSPFSIVAKCEREEGSDGACIGDGTMHSKLFLFKQVGDAHFVSTITTANLNKGSGDDLFNSAYTHVNNKPLFDRLQNYVFDLYRMRGTGEDLDYYTTNPPQIIGSVKSYFYPRASGDTVTNTLKAVECPGRIYVSMWSISRGSPTNLLGELASKGCEIEVIAYKIYDQACENLTVDGKIKLHGFSDGKPYVHQKNILMDTTYTGEFHRVVFTGSSNLNNPSLQENDEVVFRVMDEPAVYDQFHNNFNAIVEEADIHTTNELECKVKFRGQAAPTEG